MRNEGLAPGYRPDIDGLRAIAILSVVVSHASPGRLVGGFIGVDVFFVISGFLISGIVLDRVAGGTFSLREFYARRIRRIFPALALALAATLALAWFLLFADELQLLGRHTMAGAAFVSNLLQATEPGYFAGDAQAQPLQHLWSLAVEEQFYIVWPLLLVFAVKTRRNVLPFIVAIACISFVLNVLTVAAYPVQAYFSPLTRAWELMIGCALACVLARNRHRVEPYREATSLLGFSLLVLAFALIAPNRDFPGWWALLPTCGAALVIAAGPDAFLNRRVLANRWMVFIGLVSYPLYIWHWPMLSFAYIHESGVPSREVRAGAVALSLLLAYVTYEFVERPVRRRRNTAVTAVLVAVVATLGLAGYMAQAYEGFPGTAIRTRDRSDFTARYSNVSPTWTYFATADIRRRFRDECNFYDLDADARGLHTRVPLARIANSCTVPDGVHSKTAFLWGDSHAQQLSDALARNLPGNWQVLQVASSGCPPSPDFAQPSATDYCMYSNWFALEAIRRSKPDVVIVAQNLGHDAAAVYAMARRLAELGAKRVLFAGPTPHWGMPLPTIVARSAWDRPRRTFVGVDRLVLRTDAELKTHLVQLPRGAIYVSLIDYFCNGQGCLAFTGAGDADELTSWDNHHLTPAAANLLARDVLAGAVVALAPD